MTRNGVVSSQVSDAMLINHHYHFHMSVGRHESSETDKKVWVSQSNANSGKRFYTLNICFRPEGGQPRVSIIFRGQGLRLSQAELKSNPGMRMFILKQTLEQIRLLVLDG